MKINTLSIAIALAASFSVTASNSPSPVDWNKVKTEAQGQEVYFHAWGGSPEINNYLKWAGKELESRYSVTLNHIKVSDIAESTTRLLAEKAAGKDEKGSVDLVWINGENFKSMKDNDLLFGPFTDSLPNWTYVDKTLPIDTDFSEPVNGLEAPWGVGQLVFIHDSETLPNPPKNFTEYLNYAKANPNRLSYPKPPEFHGTSFLKALLIELSNNDPRLSQPVEPALFSKLTMPLWEYLDNFHQVAWRGGKQFPSGTNETIQLLDDEQLDIAITFNPNAVYSAQENGSLLDTTKAYAFEGGALSNIHFLAIPWNANAKAGALVAIDFLLSPEAQSRKGDSAIWGDPSVLVKSALTGSASQSEAYPSLAEPHPTWQAALEKEWLSRYGK
ncbi:ABC transporter substrate-binding protein [Vibrio sp.]|nr:ABC transporter substrate-binding protein [Vibrio sp.]